MGVLRVVGLLDGGGLRGLGVRVALSGGVGQIPGDLRPPGHQGGGLVQHQPLPALQSVQGVRSRLHMAQLGLEGRRHEGGALGQGAEGLRRSPHIGGEGEHPYRHGGQEQGRPAAEDLCPLTGALSSFHGSSPSFPYSHKKRYAGPEGNMTPSLGFVKGGIMWYTTKRDHPKGRWSHEGALGILPRAVHP